MSHHTYVSRQPQSRFGASLRHAPRLVVTCSLSDGSSFDLVSFRAASVSVLPYAARVSAARRRYTTDDTAGTTDTATHRRSWGKPPPTRNWATSGSPQHLRCSSRDALHITDRVHAAPCHHVSPSALCRAFSTTMQPCTAPPAPRYSPAPPQRQHLAQQTRHCVQLNKRAVVCSAHAEPRQDRAASSWGGGLEGRIGALVSAGIWPSSSWSLCAQSFWCGLFAASL